MPGSVFFLFTDTIDQHLEEVHNNQTKPALSLSIKSKHREILLREKKVFISKENTQIVGI
ncbi:hypothetical protein NEOC84_001682|nr:hypothetical protein [Neochlamydia sp. AcF84]